ncbi:MAG: ATP-dependent RecD-like DNA helicase [Acutalibacteraceae bacterium]
MTDNSTLYELTGEVEEIIYRNDENGYSVIEMTVGDDSITAVGIMPFINIGESLKLIGRWKTHASYGRQFAIEACERMAPENSTAILKYLSSGAIKGIGPTMARRLVENFGDQTLEVIEKDPQRLAQIKGISLEKAKYMSSELNKIFGLREVMTHLGKYGIAPYESVKIWKTYGNKALEIVEQDPFLLCLEPVCISFDKVDLIAQSMERSVDDICRVRAGIVHILNHNRGNGHTCLPTDRLLSASADFLGVSEERAESALQELLTDGTLVCDVIDNKSFIFTATLYESEAYSAARLLMLLKFPAMEIPNIDKEIEKIEKERKIEYAELQRKAITEALTKGMLILTGGPGTGKTTTLNAIIKILKKNGQKVFLAAPTGRAAQRMSEVTGCEAKTIHRLLEVAWDAEDRPIFKRNEKNMLNCDALILDELSMVDSLIFDSVLRALPMGCRLILVGDSDQLPSVGAGNVLGDLIASGVMPVVQLSEIFRQSMQSLIVTNAHSIIKGILPDISRRDNDFFFMQAYTVSAISKTILDLCSTRLPKTYGYSPVYDIQVLSPGRKGELGANELNKKLQAVINPASPTKKEITVNGLCLREGDKVMQIKNNYNILWLKEDGSNGEGVFNGDIGILVEVNKNSQILKVRFDDRIATYNAESAVDLDLAYATTVHKSQGNEFEAVIIPMFHGPAQLLYRNLLYTAVTRAKKLLILVGLPDIVKQMVNNNRHAKRYSGLKEFIIRGEENADL